MSAIDDGLSRFAESLRNQIQLDASREGEEAAPSEVLTAHVIDVLIEAGELGDAEPTYYKARGVEVHGYGIDEDGTLNLISTICRSHVPPGSVTRTDIDAAFKRLQVFWERCRDRPVHQDMEESSDEYDMAMRIHDAADEVAVVRMFLVTDGVAATQFLDTEMVDDIEVRRSIWDISRLHRLASSGQSREAIEVDLTEHHGHPLPCLSAGSGEEDYSAFLAVIPGRVLGEIYDRYGPRLLELNVRSFLQAKGAVNRGIRDTLINDPKRFLAYNNGIAATAESVEVVDLPDGGHGIARIRNLQIVNGGQTTASIHRALRAGVDLDDVNVQAKITVIDSDRLGEIVPLISRFANSQNKVSEADLTANDEFHVQIEALSRTVWTPVSDGHRRATHWFYERARGQYADAYSRELSPGRRKSFKEEWPTGQKFTKTDLAKYEMCWQQLPHLVSLGAQKNFTLFMERLHEQPVVPDTAYYEDLIAKAILFKETDRIVAKQKFGGYKANITAYTVARLSLETDQQLSLRTIWAEQDIDVALADAVADLSHVAFHVIAELTPNGANVTEWCKREACWNLMREQPWRAPSTLTATAMPMRSGGGNGEVDALSLDAAGWLELSTWAKQTGHLTGWDRKFAYGLGVRLKRGQELSPKQTAQAERVLREALGAGFAFEGDVQTI